MNAEIGGGPHDQSALARVRNRAFTELRGYECCTWVGHL